MAYNTIKPKDHFRYVSFTGNGSTNAITYPSALFDSGFVADYIMMRGVSGSQGNRELTVYSRAARSGQSNALFTGKPLTTDSTSNPTIHGSSVTNGGINSIDSNGFTLGSGDAGSPAYVNTNSVNYMAYAFKLNATGQSNTGGSITSTTYTNDTAGMSLVEYTGTGSTGTVAHGLSAKPEFVFQYPVNEASAAEVNASSWNGHRGQTGHYAQLNASTTYSSGNFFTGVSDTLITLSSGNQVNQSGKKYNLMCFRSVEGFSRVGVIKSGKNGTSTFSNISYGSNQVYLGFRPALVLFRSMQKNHANLSDGAASGQSHKLYSLARHKGIYGTVTLAGTSYSAGNRSGLYERISGQDGTTDAESTFAECRYLSNGFRLVYGTLDSDGPGHITGGSKFSDIMYLALAGENLLGGSKSQPALAPVE